MSEPTDSTNPIPPLPPPPPSPARFATPQSLLQCMRVNQVEPSPFKKYGPELPISIWEPEGEGVVRVRIDMPGVNALRVQSDRDKNAINFKGSEESIAMHGIGEPGGFRVYEGSVEFDRVRFPDLDFTYNFWNGVLRLSIPCPTPATSADLGVVLKIQSEEMKESAINPLVSKGKDRHYLHGFTEKAFILAVDMPGISEHGHLILDATKDTVKFIAEDSTQSVYGEGLNEIREYKGSFKVDSEEFDANSAQFEIDHGVFWILVPRFVKPLTVLATIYHDGRSEKVFNKC